MTKKSSHSVTLFEVLVVGLVVIVFGLLLIKPMGKARHVGIKTSLTEMGALHGTRLDMTNVPLDQVQPEVISLLEDLKHLYVDHTLFDDADVKQISNLSELQELRLVGTNVTDKCIPHIAKMKKLKALDLRGTFITDKGVKGLASLKHLQHLRLAQTWITDESLKTIEKMRQLRTVDVAHTSLTHNATAQPGPPGRLPVFSRGYSGGDPLFDSTMVRLPSASRRQLNPQPASLCAPELKIFPGLQFAKCDYTSKNGFIDSISCDGAGMTNETLQSLMWCRNLNSLQLSNTSLTSDGWSKIYRNVLLEKIELRQVTVDPQVAKSLSRLPNLRHLITDSINDDGLKALKCRPLLSLTLNTDSLTSSAWSTIHENEQLQSLNLTGPVIDKFVAKQLSKVKDFKTLKTNGMTSEGLRTLDATTLVTMEVHNSGIDPAAWSGSGVRFRSLEFLTVKGSVINEEVTHQWSIVPFQEIITDGMTDDGLKELVTTRTQILNLSGSPVTDKGLTYLTRLMFPKLRILYLDHCNVTDAAAEQLEKRIPGLRVYTPSKCRAMEQKQAAPSGR